DVAGSAEAVDAEPLAFAGENQAAPADQPRAEQRRLGASLRRSIKRVGKAGVDDRVRRKAAVARVAGEERRIAKVLASRKAKSADAAGAPQPADAHPRAHLQRRAVADRLDHADDLVAG